MKQLLCILALQFTTYLVKSQVLIQSQLPPAGVYTKSQLWNLSLTNTDAQSANVQVEVLLTDYKNNQPVLSGISRTIVLPRGVKQLQLSELSPVTYNVLNAAYNIDLTPNGFLPVGVFNICYRVIRDDVGDYPEQVAEECDVLEIEPVSPPVLVTPFDRDSLDITRPLFTWLPPNPVSLFTNLVYDFVLVELNPNQAAVNAVQQNIPVLFQRNVAATSLQYPFSLQELDTAKTYAWRIMAKSNTMPVAGSESWIFNFKRPTQSADIKKPVYFAKLRSGEDGSFIECNGVLRFEFNNEYNDSTITIKIHDITHKGKKELLQEQLTSLVRYGLNYIELDLRDYRGMQHKHVYLAEIASPVIKKKYYLQFVYNKSLKN